MKLLRSVSILLVATLVAGTASAQGPAALAAAVAIPVRANPDAGMLAIAQSWDGELAEAVATKAAEGVRRGWTSSRQDGRWRASVSADWPLSVRGEVKSLTTTLLYDVTRGNSISSWSGLTGHWGSPIAFHCESEREQCYSVDLDAGEVTFRNAVVRHATARASGLPGLRLTGVWKMRLHLDPEGKAFR